MKELKVIRRIQSFPPRPKWAMRRYGKDWTRLSIFNALWCAGKHGVANEAWHGKYDAIKDLWPEIYEAFRCAPKNVPKLLASEDVSVRVIAEWRLKKGS